ncbi:inositol polyphosphate phosphatase [Multifurca ochricompacta]|uniref:phosphoinositide 5-phosphatase n=1 Tax=Multifurca ochricompacta TaxID=376703 RepID=A0AAD4MC05_9AGAM|nr:inositol polyphosphate phosphatase [Multifurca ochricompacta]
MHLYLVESPRILYLVTSSQEETNGRPRRALVFRAAEGNPHQAVVEFLLKDQVNLSSAVRLTSRIVKGCLGLISVADDLFLAVITSATDIGNTRPTADSAESVAKIHEVNFYCLTSSVWDDLSLIGDSLPSPTYAEQVDVMSMREMRDSYQQSSAPQPVFEHPCAALKKILASGSFYYALGPHWDISSRLAERLSRDSDAADLGAFDERFVWNEYIVRSLIDFRERLDMQEREELDRCQFIVLAIQGYVGVFTIPLPAPPTNGAPTIATLSLISRLGAKRAGTRFNTRGVDDDGNTANFVEVYLFWEQQGLQTFGQRIQITRPQASQPAFERHFAHLTEQYGYVHAINLLGSKDAEASLTSAYARHLHIAKGVWGDDIDITHFDFHQAVRLAGHDSIMRDLRRLSSISDNMDRFGFTMCDVASNEIITEQKGVFRTNCLDCLDRTNFVQDILSRTSLEQYLLLVRREWLNPNALWSYHRELWAENGDALSRIYAGTGALNTSFTRSGKRTLAGVLSDATKSVSRAYINNFQDKGKQIAIDMLLGNLSNQTQVTIFDPIHDSVRAALDARLSEYSIARTCTIFVGTWNLNGRPPSESLIPWLFPRESTPDVMVLGFQEIVPLTAQQIVQTDPEKKRIWENKIVDTLDRRPNKKCDYILLRSEQLVGTALLVFKRRNARFTGLRGMSGNKGAVSIRLEYYDTSFCFITAHLAAGHTNVDERNVDYHTIINGLHFLRGKTIDSHDNVIWLADTNYHDALDMLFAADQLNFVMDAGTAFSGYTEGPVLFRPTYKYDLGTDSYDTSEKMRIPAWTDRILYRGSKLDQSVYSVRSSGGQIIGLVLYAAFRATVHIIDHAKKAALSHLLAESVMSTAPGETLDEKLAALTFSHSKTTEAWWDTPDHPNGVIPASADIDLSTLQRGNPFDSPLDSPLSASPSSSDEELFNNALALQTPMIPAKRPPPPPPPRSKVGDSSAEV